MIRGERTFLRPASEDDLDLLVGWLADPEVYRWWEGRPLSRDEVADVYTGRRRPEVEPFVVEAEPESEELDDETGKRIMRMVVRREIQDFRPVRS